MRPAVRVSTELASSSSLLRSPWVATRSSIVFVRSNLRGYGSMPSRTSSSKLARRWRRRSDSRSSDIGVKGGTGGHGYGHGRGRGHGGDGEHGKGSTRRHGGTEGLVARRFARSAG